MALNYIKKFNKPFLQQLAKLKYKLNLFSAFPAEYGYFYIKLLDSAFWGWARS